MMGDHRVLYCHMVSRSVVLAQCWSPATLDTILSPCSGCLLISRDCRLPGTWISYSQYHFPHECACLMHLFVIFTFHFCSWMCASGPHNLCCLGAGGAFAFSKQKEEKKKRECVCVFPMQPLSKLARACAWDPPGHNGRHIVISFCSWLLFIPD